MSMNLPNLLAYIRIAMTPIVMAVVLYAEDIPHGYGLAAALFTIAALTDFADGYIARRWEITTTLGAFLDSVADKILVVGSLLALIEIGRVWAWAAFIIIVRELAVMGLRSVAALEDHTKVPPSIWGKWKAAAQFVAIGLAMVRLTDPWGPFYLDQWVMLVAVGVTVVSAWDYFKHYGGALRGAATVE